MNSKFLPFTLIMLACLVIAGCSSSALPSHKETIAAAGGDDTAIVEGLALSLHPVRDTFTTRDPVVIDVRITNVSNMISGAERDINVYSELYEGFLVYLDLQQIDEKTSGYTYHSENVDIDLDEHLPDFSHYTRLKPGYFVGRRLGFRGERLPPGIYRLTALYNNNRTDFCIASPYLSLEHLQLLQPSRGQNPGLIPLWTGTLRSNTIVFEIIRAKGDTPGSQAR